VILATNGSGKIEFILITLFTSIGYIYVNIPEARKKINRFLWHIPLNCIYFRHYI